MISILKKLIDDFRKRRLGMQKVIAIHVRHIKEYYHTHTYMILIYIKYKETLVYLLKTVPEPFL